MSITKNNQLGARRFWYFWVFMLVFLELIYLNVRIDCENFFIRVNFAAILMSS
jgi:hypothetical protein